MIVFLALIAAVLSAPGVYSGNVRLAKAFFKSVIDHPDVTYQVKLDAMRQLGEL